MIELIQPSIEYKDKVLSYKEEFLINGESLAGSAGLANCNSFEDWFQDVCTNSHKDKF